MSVAALRYLLLIGFTVSRVRATNVVIVESAVSTVVEGRVAQSVVQILFTNEGACPESKFIRFSLPVRARVTSLTMVTDTCVVEGIVEELEAAEDTYRQAADRGEATALLQSYNTTMFGLSVALPAGGSGSVSLGYMELLQRRNGLVELKVPLLTGMPADSITATVSISDPASGLRAFAVPAAIQGVKIIQEWAGNQSGATATFDVLQPTDVEGRGLPQLVEVTFDVGPLPEEGLVVMDSTGYFMHLFNPPSMQEAGMARDVVFVIDVSRSMGGAKLAAAKSAFTNLINLFTDTDLVAVQAFSTNGIESFVGPLYCNADGIAAAKDYVDWLGLVRGTNLQDAYLEGLNTLGGVARGQNVRMGSEQRGAVPLLVLLTDGNGNNPDKIAVLQRVRDANANLQAKIYNLAFGKDADFGTLQAISLYNGGQATKIYDSYGEQDAGWQIESEVSGQIGSVICTDLEVSVSAPGFLVTNGLSILAAGAELIRFGRPSLPIGRRLPSSDSFQVTTRGKSRSGAFEQTVLANLSAPSALQQPQGAAKGFVYERLRTLSAWEDTHKHLGSMQEASDTRAKALALALEFGVVWPGLTAIIAHSESCQPAATSESCTQVEKSSVDDSQLEDKSEMYDSSYHSAGWRPFLTAWSLLTALACGARLSSAPRS